MEKIFHPPCLEHRADVQCGALFLFVFPLFNDTLKLKLYMLFNILSSFGFLDKFSYHPLQLMIVRQTIKVTLNNSENSVIKSTSTIHHSRENSIY